MTLFIPITDYKNLQKAHDAFDKFIQDMKDGKYTKEELRNIIGE